MYPKKLHYEYDYSWRYFESFNDNNSIYADQLISKNYSIGLHTHTFYEIDIVLSGTAQVYFSNNSFTVEKGNVIVIPPNSEHGFSSNEKFDIFHLLIRKEFFDVCPKELTSSKGFLLLFDIKTEFNYGLSQRLSLKMSDQAITKLLSLIQIAEQFKGMEDSVYATIGFMNTITFLAAEMNNYYNLELSDSGFDAVDDIAKIVKYIHANFDQKLTIDMLANMVNMSRSTFLRHFKKHCGCSPYEYLKRIRIGKYEELIAQGVSKTNAAISSGFYDASHANKSKNEE